MTRQLVKKFIHFKCDGCSDILPTNFTEFAAALDELKKQRWIVATGLAGATTLSPKNKRIVFNHFCPDCAREKYG